MIEKQDIGTLRDHPAVAALSADLAATQRACYGKELEPLDCGASSVHVAFEDVAARHVEMQCRVRCAGFDFELQFVEPSALFDLGSALSPLVPLPLQRAGVLHAASELLQAVEQRLGARVELIGLGAAAPAFGRSKALSMNARRTGDALGQRPEGCAVFLRALQPEGWQQLLRVAAGLRPSPAKQDVRVDVTLHIEPIVLSVAELSRLECGDVLLLDLAAAQRHPLGVAFKIGRQWLPGLRAALGEGKVRITHVAQHSLDAVASPHTKSAQRREQRWSTSMNPENNNQEHPLDGVLVEIEFELGRLSMPLSGLRSLAVGQVFETQHLVDDDGVVLWCGGQRLGVGRLVTVGERLGVRVAALHGSVRDCAGTALAEHR
jgi:type III secretion system YscQ/HrcQ family protein